MKHKIELPIPNDITVGQFIEFHKTRGEINKCVVATGMSEDEVKELPLSVVKHTNETFRELISDIQELDFPKIVELDGTEYGFEPNLSKLSTGAWADIAHLEDLGRDERLHQILAILYRPITQRWGVNNVKYRIEKYTGDSMDNADLFLDYKMSQALGVLGFFLSLQKGLMSNLEMKMMKELKKAVKEMKEEFHI
jgi:hypothetical protein